MRLERLHGIFERFPDVVGFCLEPLPGVLRRSLDSLQFLLACQALRAQCAELLLIFQLGGLLGFLGLGYLYVGRTSDGLIRLVGWWIFIATMWTAVATLTVLVIGVCLWLPAVLVQLGVPVWSAGQLKAELESGCGSI